MSSPRYFGVQDLWRFCVVISLIVNIPQLLTFAWYPRFSNSLYETGALALLCQNVSSFLFGMTLALLDLESVQSSMNWYRRQKPTTRWIIRIGMLLVLTEMFFQMQLLITGPVRNASFLHLTYFVRHLVIVAAIRGFRYFIGIMHKVNRMNIENEQLKRLEIKHQLDALNNQLNPHFLFNALNILNVSIMTDPGKAQAIVHNLSDILRYNLKIQNQNLVCLSEELEVAHAFLGLYKARFGNKLMFTFEHTQLRKTWYVVPLALQLLIENAIKHNVITSEHVLHLCVQVNEEAGQLVISNSIHRKTQTDGLGIGLSNLDKRYELITGQTTIQSEDTRQFTVTIPLVESP
jgi:two-component system, LytTR family, sensor kinase